MSFTRESLYLEAQIFAIKQFILFDAHIVRMLGGVGLKVEEAL